ncbi:GntR family transcriptional regulator [Bradyrhizobium sp. BR 1433]|uniref:GntR family transcriptional regulator n=1 Tax=Bradyrhizobium sp. BR 1433 TaxID=3447967 RepID=UPI003EE5317F
MLSGEMRPGTRIRQELLAAHFGASRIPVREALKQLENEGLVVMAPNRGAWIADVNSEESIEIYKIREAVEPLAIGESVPNLTDEDIETLDRIVRELEQVTTLEEYIQLDREFHLRTYSRARMPQLLVMVERFWNSTQHFRRQFVSETYAKDGFPFSDPQHVLIMDAIRARDVEAAQVLVRLHIRRTRVVIQAKRVGRPSRPLQAVPRFRMRVSARSIEEKVPMSSGGERLLPRFLLRQVAAGYSGRRPGRGCHRCDSGGKRR